MVEPDVDFIKKCVSRNLIHSPCLELGVGYEGANNKEIITSAGISYFGSDLKPGQAVDYIINFECPIEEIEKNTDHKKFGSVLVLNVLEHTFDPIRILDNVFSIIRPGGTCVIITPTIWPLHDYPIDCWRINPNFYEEYCRRRSLVLIEDCFEYVGYQKVKDIVNEDGTYVLPSPTRNAFKRLRSKVVHKVFNTSGRGMVFPSHIATGVVIRKDA